MIEPEAEMYHFRLLKLISGSENSDQMQISSGETDRIVR